jgi:hypothetical protein
MKPTMVVLLWVHLKDERAPPRSTRRECRRACAGTARVRSLLILALAPAGAAACGSPPSLAPLTRDGLPSVRAAFNAGAAGPRAIVFFSSGCAACDTGSRALADALATIPRPVTLLAVWEPIAADDPPPTPNLIANLPDPRVRQLWDPAHLMSDEMRASEVAHPGSPRQARTRTDNADAGIMYDTVALFAPGARWEATLPAPDYLEVGLAAIIVDVREKLLAMP